MSATSDPEDDVFAEALTEDKLRLVTGFDDLTCVLAAELRVDSTAVTVAALGELLPKVLELRLGRSSVPSLREFGTQLTRLQRLWLNQSALRDLNGAASLHQLRELYIAFNSVSSLSPLGSLLGLEVLDAEGNAIAEQSEVEGLGGLSELTTVTLAGNPVASAAGFRLRCLGVLPQLQVLDDEAVTEGERSIAAAQAELASHAEDESTSEVQPQRHMDPELLLLQESIRCNRDVGVDTVVADTHRGLVSRQTSSAVGSRRGAHTPATRVGAPPTSSRGQVSSAPAELHSPPKAARTEDEVLEIARGQMRSQVLRRSSQDFRTAAAARPPSPPSNSASGTFTVAGNIVRSLRGKRALPARLNPLDDSGPLPPVPPVSPPRDSPRKAQAEAADDLRELLALADGALALTAPDALHVDDESDEDDRVVAWKARLAEYHAEGGAARPMTGDEALHAVKAHKANEQRLLQEDLMQEAVGDDNYESLTLQEVGSGMDAL